MQLISGNQYPANLLNLSVPIGIFLIEFLGLSLYSITTWEFLFLLARDQETVNEILVSINNPIFL